VPWWQNCTVTFIISCRVWRKLWSVGIKLALQLRTLLQCSVSLLLAAVSFSFSCRAQQSLTLQMAIIKIPDHETLLTLHPTHPHPLQKKADISR